MVEIFTLIEDLSLPIVVVLLGELFIFTIVSIVFIIVTAHSLKEISNSVGKLDECVKTISDELDDVADVIHDLKDHS